MNTAIMILAACGVLAFPNGQAKFDEPAHITAIQANSTVAAGTLKLESVGKYTTAADVTTYLTNVVHKGQSIEKRDAYVGTELVYYGGSTATAWSNEWITVTNVVDSVTNVVTFNEQTLLDGSAKGVWTNVATTIRQRYETAIATVTNVTTVTTTSYTDHPFTNTVFDVTLASGKYSAVTNIFVPAGMVIGSGSAVTNGAAWIFVDK